jgi:hypothetical protein
MDESGGQVSNSNAYSTAPSSTTITTGSDNVSGGAATDVMCYAWKAVAGVSAFGSYAGNDNITGAFVNTGFYPRFLMVKCITDGSNWMIWDSVRSGATTTGSSMLPRVRSNTAEAEVSNANDVEWYLSGSDKGWRPLTAEGGLNGASTRTYIYLAFA